MPNEKISDLSDRELDILKLVATGASNKEIGQQLFISLNTVKVHLRNIFGKIGVTSRTEAAMYAVRIGLVESVSPRVDSKEGLMVDTTLPAARDSRRLSFTYLGALGGFVALLLIAGFITRWGDVFSLTPTSTPIAAPRAQWFKLANLPTPRWGLAAVNYENQIYAIGGESLSGISGVTEKYDPKTNSWSTMAAKPTPVIDASAAVIGGLIYVPGGNIGSDRPTDVNEIYNPGTNQWSTGHPMPKAMSAYAIAVYEGRIYIFGGWDGTRVVKDAYVYDFRNDTWSSISPIPTARSNAGAVVVGSKIYLVGGWDGSQALTVDEIFKPDYATESSAWETGPALPAGRYGMGITNLADSIFLVGGEGVEDNLTTIALAPGEKNWGQLETSIQSGLTFPGAATVGSRLYVVGGKSQGEISDQVWAYQAIFTITLPIIR